MARWKYLHRRFPRLKGHSQGTKELKYQPWCIVVGETQYKHHVMNSMFTGSLSKLHGSVQKATYYQFLKVEFLEVFLRFVALTLFQGFHFDSTLLAISLAYSHTSYDFNYPGLTRTWHCTKANIRSTNCILPTGLSIFIHSTALSSSLTSAPDQLLDPYVQQRLTARLTKQSSNTTNSSRPCLSGLVYVWYSW